MAASMLSFTGTESASEMTDWSWFGKDVDAAMIGFHLVVVIIRSEIE